MLCLVTTFAWSQKRYSASELEEYGLADAEGFTTKDVENKTDVLLGLHASLYSGSHHLVGFSADGAWSTFLNNMPNAFSTPGGGSCGLHLLYEYQYSGLLIQTGIGIKYQKVFTHLADSSIYHYHMTDTWSSVLPVEFTLKHHFTDRQDISQQIYGQIPFYAGHYFFGSYGMGYFLVGIHFNYAFWGDTRQKMLCSTSGLYERYVGVWEEMDNHGFRKNVPLERSGNKLKLKFDVMAHAEIGYEYNTRQSVRDYRVRPSDRLDCRIRLAGFLDMGIINICPNTNMTLYDIPEATIYDFSTYSMDHVFATKDAKHFWVRNFSVGVRLTVLFGFLKEEKCILCDPWRH